MDSYGYLYYPMKLYKNNYIRLKYGDWALEFSADISNLGINKIGDAKNGYEEAVTVKSFAECVFSNGTERCTETSPSYTAPEWYWSALNNYRMIEVGRYVNKFDMMYLCFPNSHIKGRMEIFGLPDGFTFLMDCIADGEAAPCKLRYGMALPAECGAKPFNSGARFTANGVEFYVEPNGGSTVTVDGNTIILESMELVPSAEFKGLGARFSVGKPFNKQLANVAFEAIYPLGGKGVYNAGYGVQSFIMQEGEWQNYNIPEHRNLYDRVVFTASNPTNEEILLPVCFEKSGFSFPVTGMSPMLRDASTGEPTGEAVQITKDWHIHPDRNECGEWFACDANDPRRLYEGKWSKLYAVVKIPPFSQVKREFTCAYENWGEYCAVSHAQLSLVGWGGYNLWEQTALGSHGESICYQADGARIGSFVADVRPLYVLGAYGSRERYNWTGNVGGADLISLIKNGERVELCNSVVRFTSQCPVLAITDYDMITEGGELSCRLRISEGRQTDALKVFFDYDITCLKDFTCDTLGYFTYPASGYAPKAFTRVAFGSADGVISERAITRGAFSQAIAKGDGKWAFFYGVPSEADESYSALDDLTKAMAKDQNSCTLVCVREFKENIGGSINESVTFTVGEDNGRTVSVMTGQSTKGLSKGDSVHLVVELIVLPRNYEDFYGGSALDDYKDVLNTPKAALKAVKDNTLCITPKKGSVICAYPVTVKAENDEAVFEVNGGHGLINVRAEGFSKYSGVSFYQNGVKMDGSVIGNDYWQTDYDEISGTYAFSVSFPASGRDVLEIRVK